MIAWKLKRSGTDGCLLNVGSVLSHLTKGAFVSLFPVFYLSFLCFFFAFFVCFCTFFLHFWHVCIISFKFLNWKTLYFKVQLTKRPPAPFSRSNSEVDFVLLSVVLRGEFNTEVLRQNIQFSIEGVHYAHYAKEWLNILELRCALFCSQVT